MCLLLENTKISGVPTIQRELIWKCFLPIFFPSNFSVCVCIYTFFSFLKKIFYLFMFRWKGGGKVEKHQCVAASHAPPTGDLA